MNHPSPEQWMEFLYGELPRASRKNFRDHLQTCADCQAQVTPWREAMRILDVDQAGPRRRWRALVQPVAKWAVAAMLFLSFGYALGRWAGPAVDLPAFRNSLESELREKLRRDLQTEWKATLADAGAQWRQELQQAYAQGVDKVAEATTAAARTEARRLLAEFLQTYSVARLEDRQAVQLQLQQLENLHYADCAALRQDLETVAVLTQDQLGSTRQQLRQLASFNPPLRLLNNPADGPNPEEKQQ